MSCMTSDWWLTEWSSSSC